MQVDPSSLFRYAGLLLGLLLLVNAALFFVGRLARRQDTTGEMRPVFAARWSVVDLWWGAQLIGLVLLFVLIPIVGALITLGKVPISDLNALSGSGARGATVLSVKAVMWVLLPSVIVQNVSLFVVPAAWFNLRYGLPLRAIGLPPLPRRRDVVAGVLVGVLAIAVGLVVESVISTVAEHFRYVGWVRALLDTDKNNAVVGMMHVLRKAGWAGLLLGVVGVGIAAPLGEEMVFRGWAFNSLSRRFGLPVGLIGSALLFAAPHSYGFGLVSVFLMGLLLAWTYRNSGSLWVPIIIHATNNTTQVVLAYFFPGLV